MISNKRKPLTQKLLKLKLKPIEIYSQINSVIKGSLKSHLSYSNCITKEDYLNLGKKLTDLPDLDTIYETFCEYETWKKNNNLFDTQDLIRKVKVEYKNIKLLDYLFLDEVQVLTINQIYLLILITKYPKVYAGDTCQTISQINRFRFCDLNNIFYQFENILPNASKIEGGLLNLNYRLNSKILKLATFLSYLIRELFPNTLDKIQNNYSVKITKYYPVIINKLDAITNILTNISNISTNYTFSTQHCFICKNKEIAKALELKYQKQIFTSDIFRSKGLEYEVVIIYNFFSDSKFSSIWNQIIKNIIIKDKEETNVYTKGLWQLLAQENLKNVLYSLNLFNEETSEKKFYELYIK